ncbi:jg10317 [Pararge aegeria aegeria]|uniref:Jg10317 protein n=1 Tax=Pararge aegeria aegeria TaxID=348720 RepID=A0A8S4RZP1_9NEOP|nr:jg10317 [Pararge aegeria aegeria]
MGPAMHYVAIHKDSPAFRGVGLRLMTIVPDGEFCLITWVIGIQDIYGCHTHEQCSCLISSDDILDCTRTRLLTKKKIINKAERTKSLDPGIGRHSRLYNTPLESQKKRTNSIKVASAEHKQCKTSY